jgi:hypothetical protein
VRFEKRFSLLAISQLLNRIDLGLSVRVLVTDTYPRAWILEDRFAHEALRGGPNLDGFGH